MKYPITFLAGMLGFVAACPAQPVAPTVDASDAAPAPTSKPVVGTGCDAACAALYNVGCVEGVDANCVDVCTHALKTGITDLKPACLARAQSKAEARACGNLACP